MDRQPGVGQVLQERHERLTTTPGDRQLVDLTEWACGAGRRRRPGRSATGSRHGRGPARAGRSTRRRGVAGPAVVAAWARVSSATSRWYSTSSAISGARCSRTPRPRWRSSRGPNNRGLVDQVGLGLHDQVVTQVFRQGIHGLDDRPRLGQVQNAGRQPVGSPGPPRLKRRSQRRRDGERSQALSRVWWASQVAVDRSPVSSAMSSRSCEDPQLFGRPAVPWPARRGAGIRIVRRSNGTPGGSRRARPTRRRAGRAARRTCWTYNDPSTDHRQSSASEPPVHKGF